MTSPGKVRTVRYTIFGLLAAALLYGFYLYVQPRVEVVDLSRVEYSSKYGYPENFREEYFSRVFPGAEEIESYWKNATLIITDPQFGNVVYYFDDDHHFLSWTGGVLNTYEWALSPQQQLLKLGTRSRSIVIQRFCFVLPAYPAATQEDNCRLVRETSKLHRGGRLSTNDYRKGDVFGLFGRKNPPFPLPGKGPIGFDSLLTQLSKG